LSSKTGKHKTRTAWQDSDKNRAVATFKATGNLAKTSRITGIPERTLFLWIKETWWGEKMQQLKAEDTAELEDSFTSIAKLSTDVVKERLTNGDFILNRDGQLVRKPVSARDAAIVGGISVQKRKELSEQPQRSDELGTAERLLKLVEQFARFANATEIKGVLKSTEHAQSKPQELEFVESSGPPATFSERVIQVQREVNIPKTFNPDEPP
jgi:transposase-like protein